MSWIEYGKPFADFARDGLCRPGVQLIYVEEYSEATKGQEIRILIGDRDVGGGIEREDFDVLRGEIVVRYRVLVTPEQLAG